MSKQLILCEECRDFTDYIVTNIKMTGTIKGINYDYTGKIAKCNVCGATVYVPEINDYNLESLYNAYRNKNGIISLDVIRAIPNKYNIGKRPLSYLLGWGGQTFSRYYAGDIPTKQYSKVLTKIYNNPEYYAEILEAGKVILNNVAYKKSRKAVDALLKTNKSYNTKIEEAINYILNRCEDITPLALQKVLYYIQGFYYAFYNRFIFVNECEAWVHGPVYREIYFKYRDYRFDPIEISGKEFCDSLLSENEKNIIDAVMNGFCCYSGKTLEQFTHSEEPWIIARGNLPASAPSNKIISHDSIGVYFVAIKKRYNMSIPSDISTYATTKFTEIHH